MKMHCKYCKKEMIGKPCVLKRQKEKTGACRKCYLEIVLPRMNTERLFGKRGEQSKSWRGGWRNKIGNCLDCGKKLGSVSSRYCHRHAIARERSINWSGGPGSCVDCGKPLARYGAKRCTPCRGKAIRGPAHHNWIGGDKNLYIKIRGLQKYYDWRMEVYRRDDFLCQMCGDGHYGKKKLHANHIKRYLVILQENNIKTVEEALVCDELWDIDNGITLCNVCHESIRTKEEKYQQLFIDIIINKKEYVGKDDKTR